MIDILSTFIDIIDTGNAFYLILSCFVLLRLSMYLAGTEVQLKKISVCIAIVVFLAFLHHAFIEFPVSTAEDLWDAIFRSLMCLGITFSLALLILLVLASVYRPLITEYRNHRQRLQWAAERLKAHQEQQEQERQNKEEYDRWLEKQKIEQSPERRAAVYQQTINQLRKEYELEQDNLHHAGFDEDELEFALADAKQRYFKRLRGAMQNR